jgi:hypothetical protein
MIQLAPQLEALTSLSAPLPTGALTPAESQADPHGGAGRCSPGTLRSPDAPRPHIGRFREKGAAR